MTAEVSGSETMGGRRLGPLLLAGVVVAPLPFAFMLLRDGYSTLARTAAFVWLLAWVLLVVSAFNVAANAFLYTSHIEPKSIVYSEDQVKAELRKAAQPQPPATAKP